VREADGSWTSARLNSHASFTAVAGKIMIVRAEIKLGQAPASRQQGIWPAFWTLGDSSMFTFYLHSHFPAYINTNTFFLQSVTALPGLIAVSSTLWSK